MNSITPATICARCHKLLRDHPPHKNGKPARWECGHEIDGNNRGNLRLEASTCNRIAGGKVGYSRGIARHRASGVAARRTAGPHYPGHYNLTDPTSIGAPPCVPMEGQLCENCRAYAASSSRHK